MKSLKLIGLALGASLALSTTALAQDISIAVAGPMTGGESAFGRQMKNGAEQAVADINAAGGVLGKKLALQVGDDACDPKQARSVAEKFASAKIPFVVLLACATRFLHYALFGGSLLSPTGFLIDLVWIGLCATVAYRMTRAAKMVRQYPWLYERAGLFGWRDRRPAAR